MTYGNEATLDFKYSHAVILIDVPEAEKKGTEQGILASVDGLSGS